MGRTGSVSSGSLGAPTCGFSSPVSGRSSTCPEICAHQVSGDVPTAQITEGQHVRSVEVATEPCVRSFPSSLGLGCPPQKFRSDQKLYTPGLSQQSLDGHAPPPPTAMPAMPSFGIQACGQERVPCALHTGCCSSVEHPPSSHHHMPAAGLQALWPKPVERVDRARKPRSPPSFRSVQGNTGTDGIEAYLQRLHVISAPSPQVPTRHCQALGWSPPVMDKRAMSRELNCHLNVRPGAHIRASPSSEALPALPKCRLESQAFGRGCSSLGSAFVGVQCTQHTP